LADGCDSHAEGGGVFVREVVRQLALDVALCYGVLREAAVLLFYGVDAVGEACDAVAFLEVLCDFGADFNDSSRVVAACGAALALLGEAGDGDVLPVVRLAGARHWSCLEVLRAYQSVLGEHEVSRAQIWCNHIWDILRVQGNSLDLDEDVIIPHLGQRDFLDLGLARLDDLDGLHGLGEVRHCEVCMMRCSCLGKMVVLQKVCS
jgi:hypothetical protein